MITRKIAPRSRRAARRGQAGRATPLTALALAELARDAGVPDGVLQVVTGDREDAPAIGGELTANPAVR